MTAPRPFTVGIIQDAASDDAAATVAASTERIREAADRGAQIVCLKELFNAPYFCQSQRCERFDLAETIPGPTTDRMQMVAQELGIVLIVPLFERQAPGVYRNSAAIIDADGSLLGVYRKMHISSTRSTTSPRAMRRRMTASTRSAESPGRRAGFACGRRGSRTSAC
jgi:N-carbamoylputrescine amidase